LLCILTGSFFACFRGSYGLRGFESIVGGGDIEGYTYFWGLIENLIIIAIGMVVGFCIIKELKKTRVWKWAVI